MLDALTESTNAMSEKYNITQIGIQFVGDLTLAEWEEMGVKLGRVGRCVGFLIGDWLAYGEGKGERYYKPRGVEQTHIPTIYSRAMEITRLEYNTLRDYAKTAKAVKLCVRTHNLAFSVQRAVAPIKSEDEQRKWLALAERHEMSKRRLARSIEAGKPLSREEVISSEPAVRGVVTLPLLVNRLDAWLRDRMDSGFDAERAEVWLQDLQPVLDIAEELREALAAYEADAR